MTEFLAGIPARHNRDLQRCRRLMRAAAAAGCHGVTLQLYRTARRYPPQVLQLDPRLLTQRRGELPLHLLPDLHDCAGELGLSFGLMPGDLELVDAARPHVDFLCLGPHDLPWEDLVQHAAGTGLPLLLGTGMADAGEAWNALQIALEAGCADLTVLHSVCRHPLPADSCNLAAIGTLRELLVREFTPLFGDVDLKAGWADHSISPGVVARAINHWGCDTVWCELDLTDSAPTTAEMPHWRPDELAAVIVGGYLPVQRECDGNGRIAPDPAEMQARQWRADPGDGRRPLRSLREDWCRGRAVEAGTSPLICLVAGGPGPGHLSRCLALAESLRGDHRAEVVLFVAGTPAQAQLIEGQGFQWRAYAKLRQAVGMIHTDLALRQAGRPCLVVLDVAEPVAPVVRLLRGLGLAVAVVGEPEDDHGTGEPDLALVPSFGWVPPADGPNTLLGGTSSLLIGAEVRELRDAVIERGNGTSEPRVVVCFGATDPHDLTTRTATALHGIRSAAEVWLVLNPTVDPHGLVAQVLAERFPACRIISEGGSPALALAGADLVLTAMGETAYEALCLGVPVVLVADQAEAVAAAERVAGSGAAVYLGRHEDLPDEVLADRLRALLTDPDRLSRLRYHARVVAAEELDGCGAVRAAARLMPLARARD